MSWHDIWILYGYSSAVNKVVNTKKEPVFDIDTSTNESWIYENFGNMYGVGLGQWASAPHQGIVLFYHSNHLGFGVTYSEAGMWLEVMQQNMNNLWPRNGGRWYIGHPAGITNINITNGEKYATLANVTSWRAEIQSQQVTYHRQMWITEYEIVAG